VAVTTIPLTLLSAANLIIAWQVVGPRRAWWLAAAAVVVLERIFTFSYFIPTILRLQSASLPQTTIKAAVSQWTRLNYFRNALTLVGWLAALKALSLVA
jgi:hypothetical protein